MAYPRWRLTRVTGDNDFQQFTDSNGRISHDGHQFLDISYNVLNFPKEITNDEGMTATYTYLSDGSKRRVSTHDGLGKLYRGSGPLIDFGARNYDPWSARWTTTAPMAQKYFSMSPYNYCAGNPVMYLDQNGEKGENPEDSLRLGSNMGNIL